MSSTRFITPQIIHIDKGTMYELGSLFIRMQEFYESPNNTFRGQYFTLDEYMDWYASNRPDKKFTYFQDWAGFNIPGSSLISFWKIFTEKEGTLRPKEMELFKLIENFILSDDPKFYVIGTFSADERTIEHEARHANYYLNEDYRQQCDEIFKQLPESIKSVVTLKLQDMGYSDIVIADETQAYFGSEPLKSLKKIFVTPETLAPWAKKFKQVKSCI